MGLITKIFGTYSDRELKQIYPIVDKIEALEPEYQAMTDAQLTAKTTEFKERLAKGETLDDIKEALGYVDYFFPNYDEACLMTEETELEKIADRFLDCGIQHVVIKTGKKGCYIKSQDGSVLEVPAMKGITAIDTIGAGDNFASGFITAILEGKSLKECAEFANVTASISVQSIGATTGVQKREQVDERMKEYYAQQS